MDKLNPCPFCGGNPKLFDDLDGYQVMCLTQNCYAGALMKFGENRHTAIQAWNTRASDWVNVKDRLPENRQEVLVWNKIVGIEQYRYNSDMNRWDVPWSHENKSLNIVTHWMSLPLPPTGDE